MKIISLMLDVYTIIKHYSRNRSERQKRTDICTTFAKIGKIVKILTTKVFKKKYTYY
jgi:hypothetical protein